MLRFTYGRGLGDFVGKDGRLGQERCFNLLLAFGVCSHASDMRSGFNPLRHQKRLKRAGNGDNCIRLRCNLFSADRLKWQADFFGHCAKLRQHFGVRVPGNDTFKVALFRSRAQLELCLMASTDHAEHFRIFAREMSDGY